MKERNLLMMCQEQDGHPIIGAQEPGDGVDGIDRDCDGARACTQLRGEVTLAFGCKVSFHEGFACVDRSRKTMSIESRPLPQGDR